MSESGCCTTNVKLVNSADPCERQPKAASHRGLSCLLTINHRPQDKNACWKNIFFISHPNICCIVCYDCSHSEHMLWTFDNILDVLNLDIIMSTTPLECLHCIICV